MTADAALSNRLPILAAQIQSAHRDTTAASITVAERAIAAGDALIEAKSLVGHGKWLPFLKDAGVSERSAQRYMALAKGRLNPDTVADLGGLVPALRFLALRDKAMACLAEAEASARTDDADIASLDTAIDIMGDMAAMFTAEKAPGRGRAP